MTPETRENLRKLWNVYPDALPVSKLHFRSVTRMMCHRPALLNLTSEPRRKNGMRRNAEPHYALSGAGWAMAAELFGEEQPA
jgi:hypothetical protein